MFDEIKFTELTRDLIDCDYALGDTSKGYDCVSAICHVYKGMGANIPDEWKGLTFETYATRFGGDHWEDDLIEFSRSLGHSVEINYIRKGDLIVFDKPPIRGPGIYLGNGYVFRIYDGAIRGGKVSPLRYFHDAIVDIRRLI